MQSAAIASTAQLVYWPLRVKATVRYDDNNTLRRAPFCSAIVKSISTDRRGPSRPERARTCSSARLRNPRNAQCCSRCRERQRIHPRSAALPPTRSHLNLHVDLTIPPRHCAHCAARDRTPCRKSSLRRRLSAPRPAARRTSCTTLARPSPRAAVPMATLL